MAPTKNSVGDKTEPYVVLARKYRPSTFDDLIGQSAMVQTLRNAFKTNRIAQAYMLTGLRGIGKTTTARILARALNYENEDGSGAPTVELIDLGVHCEAIMASRHPDILEMDAASNTSVENIREIIENARYAPVSARYKVYIIDEVHMLSKSAFNALLKTLEEPPAHVKFIFATTEVNRVPVTVLSRCQRFDLRRVEPAELVEHFGKIAKTENANVTEDALRLIARASEGSVRDGLSILDQAIAHEDGELTAEAVRNMLGLADRGRVMDLLALILEGNIKGALDALASLHSDGAEPRQIVSDLGEAIHLVTRLKATGVDTGAMDLSADEAAASSALAEKMSIPALTRAWQMTLKGLQELSYASDQRAAAEMLLIRLTHSANLPTPDDLMRLLPELQGDGSGAGKTNGSSEPAPSSQPAERTEANTGSVLGLDMASPPEQPPANLNTPALGSFEAVVDLVSAKRDIILKSHLEENVRLVTFKPGQIALRMLPDAPNDLIRELTNKLKSWTGETWLVSDSDEEGRETLAETRARAHEAKMAELKTHPMIQETFSAFPEAEIISVESTGKSPESSADKKNSGEKR